MFKIDRSTVEALHESEAKALDKQAAKKLQLFKLDEAILERQKEIETFEKEADNILQKAREQAEIILSNAGEEADEIKKTAWQEGYQLGREEAQEIVNDAQKARRAEMERFLDQLKQMRNEILAKMEGDIIDFCLSVSEKVVNAAIDRDDVFFRSIVENALGKVRREGNVRVQVCPEDFERLFGSDTASFSVQGENVVVSMMANSRLDKGGCIVETDSDRVDTGVATLMEGMRKALKAL